MTAIAPSFLACFLRLAAVALLFRRRPRSVVALSLLLFAGLTAVAAACPSTAPRSSIADPAAHLGERSGAIAARLAAWQRATGHQLLVVIAPSLDGNMSIEQCAVSVFEKWKLGRKGVDDGVLLLVAIKERKMRIEVGYGLEGVLTDARSARILREVMQPLFAHGEYAEGIDQGLGAIMTVIGSAAAEPIGATGATGSANADAAEIDTMSILIVGGFALLLLLGSTTMGVVGLVFFCLPIAGLFYYFCQGWRGWLFAGTCIPVWCALRWRLIRRNAAKYHLQKSRNKTLTWLRCFAAAGLAGPDTGRDHKPLANQGVSFSFSWSGEGSGSGSSSSSDEDSGG